MEFFLAGRSACEAGQGHGRQRRTDVRGVVRARAGDPSVLDGSRARRWRAGARLDDHARRPARVGASPRHAGLPRVRRRSARARTLAISSRPAGPLRRASRHIRRHVEAVHRAGEGAYAVRPAGQAAHAVAGCHRRRGRSDTRSGGRRAGRRIRPRHRAHARRVGRARWRTAGQDRAGGDRDPFRGRPLCVDCRQREAESRGGPPSRGTSRPAVRQSPLRRGGKPARVRSAGRRCVRAEDRRSAADRTGPRQVL